MRVVSLLLSLSAAPAFAQDDPPGPPRSGSPPTDVDDDTDSDGDQLPDEAEDADDDGRRDFHETDPHKADTDGDGASDWLEQQLGTDPTKNSLLEFPEPMAFDMVRGFGAKKGEFEANVLARMATRQGPAELVWAPEIEVAIVDNFAVELEAGFSNSTFHGLKVGLQGTLGMNEAHTLTHGIQALAEWLPHDGGPDDLSTTLLYMGAVRLAPRWSLVGMIGPELVFTPRAEADVLTHTALVTNLSAFYAVSDTLTVGLENNVATGFHGAFYRLMPQTHLQVNHRLRIQAGFGLLVDPEPPEEARKVAGEGALRVITEF